MSTSLPPSKKAKTQPDEGNTAERSGAPTFFLDSFPKEVMPNVLRYFSRTPEAEDWVPRIPAESLIELFGVRGELGNLMKTRFNSLCIARAVKAFDEELVCKWKKREGDMLWIWRWLVVSSKPEGAIIAHSYYCFRDI